MLLPHAPGVSGNTVPLTVLLPVQMILGASETLCSDDTYQFEDFSKVYAPCFDAEHKAKVHAELFPIDCEKAFSMGARLIGELRKNTAPIPSSRPGSPELRPDLGAG